MLALKKLKKNIYFHIKILNSPYFHAKMRSIVKFNRWAHESCRTLCMFYIKSFEKIFNIFSLIEDPFLLLFDWKKLNPLIIMLVSNLLCISF